jgi:hypothetical protein
VPLFDTILSKLSSSWSSLLGANWRTLIDSDSNSTTSGSSDLLDDAELNSLPDLGSISGMDDEICEGSSSESDEWHKDMFMDPGTTVMMRKTQTPSLRMKNLTALGVTFAR